jgi:hypothetical protein
VTAFADAAARSVASQLERLVAGRASGRTIQAAAQSVCPFDLDNVTMTARPAGATVTVRARELSRSISALAVKARCGIACVKAAPPVRFRAQLLAAVLSGAMAARFYRVASRTTFADSGWLRFRAAVVIKSCSTATARHGVLSRTN